MPLLKTGQQLIAYGTEGTWIAYAAYLSVDNGKTWKQVSGKDGADGSDGADGNDGDSMFTSIDYTSNKDYVVFTLANNGGDILVPKYKGTTLELKYSEDTWGVGESREIDCIITIPDNSTYQLEFISPKGWKLEKITKDGVLPVKLKVTAPQSDDLPTADYEGKLIVMLNVDNDVSIIRTIDLSIIFNTSSEATIAKLLNGGYEGKFLIVRGEEISEEDWEALRNNATIQHLDLSEMMQTPGKEDEYYTMPPNALESNKTLETVKLPKTLKNIGKGAFRECESLQEIEIPKNVKHIPEEVFWKCYSLKKVSLPDGLEKIGSSGSEKSYSMNGTFRECKMLGNIIIPSACKVIGPAAFCEAGSELSALTYSLTIPKDVKLNYMAFQKCGMTELKLNTDRADTLETSDGVPKRTAPKEIFMKCLNLKKVVIGEGVKHSPGVSEDFKYCTSLETVDLPSTFETIRKGMFGECVNLKSIIWRNTNHEKMEIEFYKDMDKYSPADTINYNGQILTKTPFVGTNEIFKIYVPDNVVDPMKEKYDSLKEHFDSIDNMP